MSGDPAKAWEGLLGPDERIVWQGRPAVRFSLKPSDLLFSGFGLAFFAFAVFWTVMAGMLSGGTGPVGVVFPLFGIPFILVGAYMLFGRFFWDVFRRSRTWYTLTNRRAFIATDIFGHRTLNDYSIEAESNIVLTQKGDFHDILFVEYWDKGHRGKSYLKTAGFEMVRDGRNVYAHLTAIRDRARDGTS